MSAEPVYWTVKLRQADDPPVAGRELDDFRERLRALKTHGALKSHLRGDALAASSLEIDGIHDLCQLEEGYYFLIAAAGLSRTSLKAAMKEPDAQLVSPKRRRAFAIRERLPIRLSFGANADKAVALRTRDLVRKQGGGTEALFRDRLKAENIPIAMSPPIRRVPGILVSQRKPDGVFPDPATGAPPHLCLEIKKVRRVSDDIQKRLYEIAEVSLEMKFLYGNLRITGEQLTSVEGVAGNSELRAKLREQILASRPAVVALLLCPRAEAEKYREGGEAFIDRIFFQEEIDDCIDYLRTQVNSAP